MTLVLTRIYHQVANVDVLIVPELHIFKWLSWYIFCDVCFATDFKKYLSSKKKFDTVIGILQSRS